MVDRVGVESTGTYGAALARHLRAAEMLIVEVDRPDRRARLAHGKSDPLDAYSAQAALSGAGSVVPKPRDAGARRSGRFAWRSSAVKGRRHAMNQIKSLIVTGPAPLREQLRHLAHLEADCGLPDSAHDINSPALHTPPRPRGADLHVAIDRSQKRSPKPTNSFVDIGRQSERHAYPGWDLGSHS